MDLKKVNADYYWPICIAPVSFRSVALLYVYNYTVQSEAYVFRLKRCEKKLPPKDIQVKGLRRNEDAMKCRRPQHKKLFAAFSESLKNKILPK